jgi:hypothetical protein
MKDRNIKPKQFYTWTYILTREVYKMCISVCLKSQNGALESLQILNLFNYVIKQDVTHDSKLELWFWGYFKELQELPN